MSIIETLLTEGYTGNIILFYSNQNVENIAFKKRLDTLAREYYRFTSYHFITRETPDSDALVKGRMTPSFIIEHVPSPNTADYFVCGSTSFTRDLWRMLKGAGIGTNHIYTEGFF
jgi:ferredoxin-NADP reductase